MRTKEIDVWVDMKMLEQYRGNEQKYSQETSKEII